MSDYVCPYCGYSSVDSYSVTRTTSVYFDKNSTGAAECPATVNISKCPHCAQYSYRFFAKNYDHGEVRFQYPAARISVIPDYVPPAIRSDYIEAVTILNASPKASATLARRCLQGMIHDYWNIHEKNLNAEITALSQSVPAAQWKAIDGLRKIGNIGAHMEADVDHIIDVDPDEADKLLRLIELLIKEWYIARHDAEQLYNDIVGISDTKEAERKSAGQNSNSK